MQPCIFLDRDGVLNHDPGDYTYKLEAFRLLDGVPQALHRLKEAGYRLVIITNQSGVAKGIFGAGEIMACYRQLQAWVGHVIDDHYYSPWHEVYSRSLTRKPGSLLFEKAIAKHRIDAARSWMIGDKERDLIPAQQLGIGRIRIHDEPVETLGEYRCDSLAEAAAYILQHPSPEHTAAKALR